MGLNWYTQQWFLSASQDGPNFYPATDAWSLNFVNMRDGDTIVRWLVGWRVETGILAATDGAQRNLWPINLAVWYEPSPTGEPNSNINTWDGDKIWRDQLSFAPQPWTDGTLYGTKFVADSGSPRSVQAQRIVHNKETALIVVGWDIVNDPPGSIVDWIPEDTLGLIQVAILVNQPGLHG